MAGYRDDLEAAKHRIEILEQVLAEREAELAARRVRPPPSPAPVGASWIRARFAVLAAIGGLAGVFMMCAERPAHDVQPSGREDPLPSLAARPRLCEPRRTLSSLADLPPGTDWVLFDRSVGCDGCAPNTRSRADACRRCSMEETLRRAGLSVSGIAGPAPRGLQASGHTVTITLDRPVSFFAAVFRPGALRTFPREPRTGVVVMKGRDADGRVVDVARAEYPAVVTEHESGEPFSSRARSLVVEGCGASGLVSIQVWSSELNMHLTDLAFESPP